VNPRTSEDDSSFRADLEQSTSNERPLMKFVSLGTEHPHPRGKFDKPSRATLEPFPKSVAMLHQIHTYTELRQQIHDDLRIQHPEWVEPDGGSPVCDSYEERLMELLDPLTRSGSNESVAAIHRALGHRTGR
jgi:hypothetical protein